MDKICYWDSDLQAQQERDATPEEQADIDARRAAALIPQVPQSIPMLNAHLVLIAAGWMAPIRIYLDGLTGPEGEAARAYLNLAQTMRRDHELVLSIPALLGKTEAEVDALFIQAATLDP